MDNVESVYALSPMQQSMLVRMLQVREQGEYTEQVCFTIEGAFQASSFVDAWQRLVERNTILRTAFYWEGLDQPLQVVRREARIEVRQEDWRELPAEERETRFAAFLDEDRVRGFDPGAAPLSRVACFRVAEETYRFVWSFHHLLLDGWSSTLAVREVFAIYEALCGGRTAELERPRPYRDFVGWLAGQSPGRAEAFWRETLAGFTSPTVLGFERPLDPAAGEAGGVVAAVLPDGTAERLRRFARQQGVTLNTVFQGAWGYLLACYGGEPDVVFGSISAGRPPEIPGVDGMLGMFLGTIPVRVRIDPAAKLVPWLRELQAVQMRARHHDYWAVSQIQGWSEVPAGRRLFDTLFVFQNLPDMETRGAGSRGRRCATWSATPPGGSSGTR